MKRILFMTHVGDPGGAEFKMIELCRAVGDSAQVMLLERGSLEALLAAKGIKFCVYPMPHRAQTVRKESDGLALLKAVPGTLSMVRHVARSAREFDAIVCISQKAFVLASLAKPFTRKPIFWFLNDILSPAHFSRTFIRLLVTLSRYSADHIAVPSQASLNAWVTAGGRKDRVSVIYPGIRAEFAAQLENTERIDFYRRRFSPDRKPLIGMFGRISAWKGQDVLLKAIAQVPNVNVVIAGAALTVDHDHELRIKALTRELGLENRVAFAGHVADVMPLMAACDVITHCSTAPEPFGQVIAQAMYAGTAVIASDAGGAREVVTPDETGQLTPLKDAEALANAIRRYLADPDWRRQLAQRAKATVQDRFSGAAMTNRFLQVIETI